MRQHDVWGLPSYAFRLSVLTTFAIYDQSYRVKIGQMVVEEHYHIVEAPHMETGTADKNWNYLITTAYKDTIDSLPVRISGNKQQTMSVLLNVWVITSFILLAIILVISCALLLYEARACLTPKNDNRAETDQTNLLMLWTIHRKFKVWLQYSELIAQKCAVIYTMLHRYDIPTASGSV